MADLYLANWSLSSCLNSSKRHFNNLINKANKLKFYKIFFSLRCATAGTLTIPAAARVEKILKIPCFVQKILSPLRFAHSALSLAKIAPPAAVIDAALFCDDFLKSQVIFFTYFFKGRFFRPHQY